LKNSISQQPCLQWRNRCACPVWREGGRAVECLCA